MTMTPENSFRESKEGAHTGPALTSEAHRITSDRIVGEMGTRQSGRCLKRSASIRAGSIRIAVRIQIYYISELL